MHIEGRRNSDNGVIALLQRDEIPVIRLARRLTDESFLAHEQDCWTPNPLYQRGWVVGTPEREKKVMSIYLPGFNDGSARH